MNRFFALLWLVLVALAMPASAQSFPPLTGRVVDQADLLRPEQELDLSSKLAALEAQTGRQFVIATLNSLEGRRAADYGYLLGRHWKIGDEQRDDGVVMIVAPKEHEVWISTGYGARVFLTDAVTSVIVRNTILPKFKAGDMAGGIMAGADQVIKTLQLSPQEAARRAREIQNSETRRQESVNPLPVIFMVVIFFFVIGSIARRAGGRRYRRRDGGISPWIVLWGLSELSRASRGRGGWSGGGWSGGSGWGGGGGGGFGGFSGGGGSFGGGGAGGSW